ncbi:TRAP transporter small permease [Mesorhizobium sp. YIM 152430]|uniref:TRAP transporter small permease n=1 Tax=Mesorhizobium sp. YIM 152430 TaxID=3031761 RepID=UPI0023DBF378|nr:TRAP transporter small permease [Mesorhizobium sp. YIM 152430]MDF1599496.1 TRAP transporter small permease [Mesorhizobium sp. YIM 152430]
MAGSSSISGNAEQDMNGAGRVIRRSLDAIYDGAGLLAALCLVAILIVIIVQVAARWAGISVHGPAEYAGYLMAAASFLAFAHTLNRGAHIRVGLLINALGERRFWAELWCLLVASAASVFLAFYACKTVYWSWRLGDISQAQDATPLWIVQTPVAVGAVILAICFLDNLATLLLTGRDNIRAGIEDQSRVE